MLTNRDIFEIIELIDDLKKKYQFSYLNLKQETFNRCESVRYSSGGNIYPFGKYFFAQSKIYRKCTRASTGHYCSTIENANFAYIYSANDELIAINQMFDSKNNNSGKVDYTSFVLSFDRKKYVLKYLEHYSKPILYEIGFF